MKKSTGKRAVPVYPPVLPKPVKNSNLRVAYPDSANTGNDSDLIHALKQKSQSNAATDNESSDTDDDIVYLGNPPKIQPWFHERIDRSDVEKLLVPRTDGLFLVRDSTNFPGDYTLCVCFEGNIEYYRIKKLKGWFTIDDEELFRSLEELVEHYRKDADGLVTKLDKYVCAQSQSQ